MVSLDARLLSQLYEKDTFWGSFQDFTFSTKHGSKEKDTVRDREEPEDMTAVVPFVHVCVSIH